MKHSGPGFLNVMQTRFYPSAVSGFHRRLATTELRERWKENFSRGFRLFIARYHALLEGRRPRAEAEEKGNSR